MSDREFFYTQFRNRGIPQGTKNYADYVAAKRLIQCQSKLSPQRYQEYLKIATDYTEYIPWSVR